MKTTGVLLGALTCFFLPCISAHAVEINPVLSIQADLAGVYQYQTLSDAPDYDNSGRSAVVFQPAMSVQLTRNDEIQAKLGFSAGNALNDTTPFVQAPWAADLEADVKGINGGERDFLLTAWYGHTFDLIDSGALTLIGGIIDSTEFLDQNVYANDQYTQFMNSALVNAPNAFLPAYDKGAAARWEKGSWRVAAVYMSVADNDDDDGGESYNFYGGQIAYSLDLEIGQGNYRLDVNGTSGDFAAAEEGGPGESKYVLLISCDQQVGDNIGVWLRVGGQDDQAAIEYEHLLSGGIDISGRLWAREQDNIGIGIAYLNGGNTGIEHGQVYEIYYRWACNEFAAISLDFQYVADDYENGNDPKGLISGVRFAAAF